MNQDIRITSNENRLIAFILLLVLVAASNCCDNQGWEIEDPLKPGDQWPRYDYESPAWSPNDDYIVYSYLVDPYLELDTVGLYLYDLKDSSATKFIAGTPRCPLTPDFSPDGEWLVFAWYEQIWKSKINGDSLTQLTFEGDINVKPSWSPNGRRIAYTSSNVRGVHIMNDDGTGDEFIVFGHSPDWLDDEHIVFCRNDLFSYDLGERREERILAMHEDWIETRSLAAKPGLPQLLFMAVYKEARRSDIWRVDVQGTNLLQLTGKGGDQPEWSPDGSMILYTNTALGRIWVMNRDGSKPRPLLGE